VQEVAISVAFTPVLGLGFAELSEFWSSLAETFRKVEMQPLFEPIIEELPGRGPELPEVRLVTASMPRLWMINSSGSELLQVQNNWFARNWRRVEGNEAYPHYGTLEPAFETDLDRFRAYLEASHLGSILATQIELTYINHIEGATVADVLEPLAGRRGSELLPNPEAMRFDEQHLVLGGDADHVSRGRISATTAIRKSDGKNLAILNLTFRGRPTERGMAGIRPFLDSAHDWIVTTFALVTSAEMHERWGREA
jgi:uncharacterized protein (TIGR04255 family)